MDERLNVDHVPASEVRQFAIGLLLVGGLAGHVRGAGSPARRHGGGQVENDSGSRTGKNPNPDGGWGTAAALPSRAGIAWNITGGAHEDPADVPRRPRRRRLDGGPRGSLHGLLQWRHPHHAGGWSAIRPGGGRHRRPHLVCRRHAGSAGGGWPGPRPEGPERAHAPARVHRLLGTLRAGGAGHAGREPRLLLRESDPGPGRRSSRSCARRGSRSTDGSSGPGTRTRCCRTERSRGPSSTVPSRRSPC